jgi:hypothetical protein
MDTTGARAIDKALNAARDPAEMRRLITRRRLIRAGMTFEQSLAQYERSNPLPAVFTDRFPVTLGR